MNTHISDILDRIGQSDYNHADVFEDAMKSAATDGKIEAAALFAIAFAISKNGPWLCASIDNVWKSVNAVVDNMP